MLRKSIRACGASICTSLLLISGTISDGSAQAVESNAPSGVSQFINNPYVTSAVGTGDSQAGTDDSQATSGQHGRASQPILPVTFTSGSQPLDSSAQPCPSCGSQDPCGCQTQSGQPQFINPDQFLCEPVPAMPCWPTPQPGYQPGYEPPSGYQPGYQPQPGYEPGYQPQPGGQPEFQPGQMPDAPTAQPGVPPGMAPPQGGAGNADSLALSSGLGTAPESGFGNAALIGDFFGGGGIISGPSWGVSQITLPIAGGDRRQKLTEHASPIPTNRVFFSYNYFNNPLVDVNNNVIDVNRYLFGVERMFLNRNASIEFRAPLLNGVAAVQDQDGQTIYRDTEFGNITLTPKFLLHRDRCGAVSTGLGIVFPTAPDGRVSSGNLTVDVENLAYHLQPFIAFHRTPSREVWGTFTTQFDFATAGNRVVSTESGRVLADELFNDQHLMFLDLSVGRWLHRQNCGRLRGIAAIFELHYTTTLNDTDVVQAGRDASSQGGPADVLANTANRLDVLNGTVGMRFAGSQQNSVTIAGVAPLRGDADSLFDGEFIIQWNHGF